MNTYWKYHSEKKAPGKKLLLPSQQELIDFGLLIINRFNSRHLNEDWFTPSLLDMNSTEYYSMMSRCRESVKILKNSLGNPNYSRAEVIDSAVKQLHSAFNNYFSDDGWRLVGKAISQAKKRANTMRTEIKATTHAQLLALKDEIKQDSIDQTIEFLIEFYRESIIDAE